ncbi:MAG: virulence RhuM family protein [Tannerellaceae bacterium]|nr:virulence RhuM family protein [Tannerellaceae bacterium]
MGKRWKRDLFSLSSDYDASDKATQMFFAETQNKLLYPKKQKKINF